MELGALQETLALILDTLRMVLALQTLACGAVAGAGAVAIWRAWTRWREGR